MGVGAETVGVVAGDAPAGGVTGMAEVFQAAQASATTALSRPVARTGTPRAFCNATVMGPVAVATEQKS